MNMIQDLTIVKQETKRTRAQIDTGTEVSPTYQISIALQDDRAITLHAREEILEQLLSSAAAALNPTLVQFASQFRVASLLQQNEDQAARIVELEEQLATALASQSPVRSVNGQVEHVVVAWTDSQPTPADIDNVPANSSVVSVTGQVGHVAFVPDLVQRPVRKVFKLGDRVSHPVRGLGTVDHYYGQFRVASVRVKFDSHDKPEWFKIVDAQLTLATEEQDKQLEPTKVSFHREVRISSESSVRNFSIASLGSVVIDDTEYAYFAEILITSEDAEPFYVRMYNMSTVELVDQALLDRKPYCVTTAMCKESP